MSLNLGLCPIFRAHNPFTNTGEYSIPCTPHLTRRNVTVHIKCMMLMHFPSCYMYIGVLHETLIHHGQLQFLHIINIHASMLIHQLAYTNMILFTQHVIHVSNNTQQGQYLGPFQQGTSRSLHKPELIWFQSSINHDYITKQATNPETSI